MLLFNKLRRLPVQSLIYEVTAQCNLHCPHCYNVWKDPDPYPKGELDTAGATQLIRKILRQSHCQQLTLTGGEPCLREDLEALVACAAKRIPHINLISNGTLLTASRVKSLIHAGVDLFELPLNGPNAECHDQMAGQTGSFAAVIRAAVDVRAQIKGLVFVFVATSKNISSWEKTLNLGLALGAQGFLLNRYNAGGSCHAQPESLMPSVEQLREVFCIAERYAGTFGIGISASIAIPPCLIDTSAYPHLGFGYCGAGTDSAYYTIDPIGNVRPCNHSPTILGNVFEHSLFTLAGNSTMQAFKAARPAFCAGCSMELTCQGGCKAAAEACFGDLCVCEPFLAQNLHLAKKQ